MTSFSEFIMQWDLRDPAMTQPAGRQLIVAEARVGPLPAIFLKFAVEKMVL
jgi:hypothetical protein